MPTQEHVEDVQPIETSNTSLQTNIEESPPVVQLSSLSNLPGSRPGSKLSRIEEDPEVEDS